MADASESRGQGPDLEGILRTAPDGLWVLDTDTRFVEVNDAICAMLGYTRAEMLAMRIADVESNESDAVAREHAERILRHGVDRFESRLRRKDGAILEVEVSAGILAHGGGRIVAFIRDVTESRQAAATAIASEQRERSLLDLLPDGVIVYRDDRIVSANAAAVKMLGAAHEGQVVGRTMADFLEGESLSASREQAEKGLAGLPMRAHTLRVRGIDGAIREVEAKAALFDGGAAVGFHVVVRDLTERMQVEAELRDREAKLRSYFDAPMVGIAITDATSGFVEVNDHYCRMLGYTREELVHRSWRELTHPDDVAHDTEVFQRLSAGEYDSRAWEKRYVRKDGSILPVLISVSATRHAGGRLRHVIAISQDISERTRAEEALRAAHQELQRHVASTPLAVVEWDGDFRVTRFTGRAEEIFGWRAAEVVGRRIDEVPWVLEGDVSFARGLRMEVQRATRPGAPSLHRIRRRDGVVIHCEWYSSSLRGADGKLTSVFSLVQDVTAREKAKAALQESEARFRVLADAAPVGIFQSDTRGNNAFINPAGQRILGLTALEVLGQGWAHAIHPDDRERVFAEWAAASSVGRDWTSQYRAVTPGGRVTWVRGYGAPTRDAAGEVTGYVGVMVDVTGEIEAQQQLGVSQRLGAMATLVAGVGHEINNPLAVAMANDGAALDDLADLQHRLAGSGPLDREEAARLVAEIRDSVEGALTGDKRIARIVQDLVALGRTDARRARIRLRDVVDASLRWLPGAPGKSGAVTVVDAGAPAVLGQASQLAQVVINLVTNASKAGEPGRTPRIVVRLGPGAPGFARLEVVDDGVGMPPEVAARAFDPFYSTREPGQGMGLGLSLCHAIVAEHGGTIRVQSAPGKGSTFTVDLPVARE